MSDKIDILGLCSAALVEDSRRNLPSGAGIAGRLYAKAFESGLLEPDSFGLSAASTFAWNERYSVGLLEVQRVVEEEGEFGPTSKALLETADGLSIECVRIPMPSAEGRARSTLCVSSQVGCRMACAFCQTGKSGLVRDLSAAEIVSQALTTRVKLGWDCGNIVFMGMGEPLDNFEELAKAIRVFSDRRGFGMAAERITVCSSGPSGGIAKLKSLGLSRLNLSVSLNAGSDAIRSALMPVNRACGLEGLRGELADYPMRRNFILGANYCLIPGLNDSREEARLVGALCARIGRVLLNLIPYNPGREALSRAPTEEEVERFALWLREAGCEVRRRATKGASIMAACGQLGGPTGTSG